MVSAYTGGPSRISYHETNTNKPLSLGVRLTPVLDWLSCQTSCHCDERMCKCEQASGHI